VGIEFDVKNIKQQSHYEHVVAWALAPTLAPSAKAGEQSLDFSERLLRGKAARSDAIPTCFFYIKIANDIIVY